MKVTGRCHCGQISFAAEIDPAQVRVCHCTDCQTLTGTAFRTAVPSLPGSFMLKSGAPKIYIQTAESGNQRAHAFCPDCGTALYAVASGPNPPFYGLRVGTLDRRAELSPARQFWCRSALPWSMDLTGVPQFEGQFEPQWVALLSERYREAVEFATEAAEANPEFPDNYAALAAAHGHLGNADAARAALDQLLRRMPGLTAVDERLNRPFGSALQRERFLEGLRLAGLPEQ